LLEAAGRLGGLGSYVMGSAPQAIDQFATPLFRLNIPAVNTAYLRLLLYEANRLQGVANTRPDIAARNRATDVNHTRPVIFLLCFFLMNH
jgi:hypothetical protein